MVMMLSLDAMPVNVYSLLILSVIFSFHFKILVLFSKMNILNFYFQIIAILIIIHVDTKREVFV